MITGYLIKFIYVDWNVLLFFLQLAKSAKEAASKVQEQTEVIGKTDTFKAVSAVSTL